MRGIGVLLMALSLGCGVGLQLETVPSDPIAFVRQEPAKGLLNLDAFREGLQIRAFEQVGDGPPARLQTTLSLLTVPSGEIRGVPDSGNGALPLDWSGDGSRLLIGRVDSLRGALQLLAWNRLTGGYEDLGSERSAGAASLGDGPIRLAGIARLLMPDGSQQQGVIIEVDRYGAVPLVGGLGGIDPDIAPDGQTVVFARPYPERPDRDAVLMAVDILGDEPRVLGHGNRPRFSRNGQWIVFTRRRTGSSDVWLMRSDGTGKRVISNSGYDEEFPAVSPDGDYVVYASARGAQEESQLYLVRVADRVETQLTQNGQNGRPVW